MSDSAALLRELAKVRAIFQARALAAVISADRDAMATGRGFLRITVDGEVQRIAPEIMELRND
jgi:hypothetical protein